MDNSRVLQPTLSILDSSEGIIFFSLDKKYCYTFFTLSHQQTMKKIWNALIKVGDCMLDFLSPADKEKAKFNFDRAFAGEHFSRLEEYGDVKLKRSFWEDRYDPIVDSEGNVTGVIVFVLDVSTHISTKLRLEETQMRLTLALKSSRTGVWQWTVSSNEIYWSDEVFKIFQVPDLTRKVDFDFYLSLIHPDDRSLVQNVLEETLLTGKEYQIEHRIVCSDGSTRWIRGVGVLFRDSDHVPNKLLGTVFDITETKIEHDLNTRLALVANATKNIVVIADAESRIEWVNPAFTRITEYTLEEVIGKKPWYLLTGEKTDLGKTEELAAAVRKGIGFKDVEIINYTKSGKPYWVSLEVQPIKDERGLIIQFIAVANDISERKKVEEKLRESEARFREIVQSSPMGLIMYELQEQDRLVLIEANHAASAILRVDCCKLVGKTIEEAFPAVAGLDIVDSYVNTAKTGTPWSARELYYDDGITRGTFEVNAFQAGSNRVAMFFNDVTERKRNEQEKQDWKIRYELLVGSSGQMIYDYDVNTGSIIWSGNTQDVMGYTNEEMGDINQWAKLIHPEDQDLVLAQLAIAKKNLSKFDVSYRFSNAKGIYKIVNDRGFFFLDSSQLGGIRMIGIMEDVTHEKEAQLAIIKKNEELTKANQELDSFVYSASHDLRAPIASLLGLIRIARYEKTVEGIGALLDLQEKSLQKLDTFIRDIVDHSRNARLEIARNEVDLKGQIQESFDQFHFLENIKKIRKEIVISQETLLYSDHRRLQIVFNNLISNAIKYADTSKPDPYICITARVTIEGATISIEDNGEGIRDSAKDRVFDMFFRASDRSAGSGLGLYIVKEVLDKLNGKITMETVLGKGTVFTIIIPN